MENKYNPQPYPSFWMVEAVKDGVTWTVDNANDLPFVDYLTAAMYAYKWSEEYPGTRYYPVEYMRLEKEKIQ